MAPPIANFLLGSFGIVAAVLLIGGSVVLRAQQNRHRFELAKRALDAGQSLPEPEPFWAVLHRQAQSILWVGIGLVIVGIAAWVLGSGVSMPDGVVVPATAPAGTILFPDRPVPPPPDPKMEAWHSAQERVDVGQTAIGCGVILTLLGVGRLNTAKAERKNV